MSLFEGVLKDLAITEFDITTSRYYKLNDVNRLKELSYGEWTMEDITNFSKISGKSLLFVVNSLKKRGS